MLNKLPEFLKYLASREKDADRIPALDQLSKELGINRTSLREQVAVAPRIGLGFRETPHRDAATALFLFAGTASKSGLCHPS